MVKVPFDVVHGAKKPHVVEPLPTNAHIFTVSILFLPPLLCIIASTVSLYEFVAGKKNVIFSSVGRALFFAFSLHTNGARVILL